MVDLKGLDLVGRSQESDLDPVGLKGRIWIRSISRVGSGSGQPQESDPDPVDLKPDPQL